MQILKTIAFDTFPVYEMQILRTIITNISLLEKIPQHVKDSIFVISILLYSSTKVVKHLLIFHILTYI